MCVTPETGSITSFTAAAGTPQCALGVKQFNLGGQLYGLSKYSECVSGRKDD